MMRLYDVMPETGAPNGDRRSSLLDAARQELGIEAFLKNGNYTVFTPYLPGICMASTSCPGPLHRSG